MRVFHVLRSNPGMRYHDLGPAGTTTTDRPPDALAVSSVPWTPWGYDVTLAGKPQPEPAT
jgi:hypothetical protein